MTRRTARAAIAAIAAILPVLGGAVDRAAAQDDDADPTIAERTADMERLDGPLTLHLDHDAGAVWIEVPAPGPDGHVGSFIYVESLRTGLGSNPVGLDRGQLGDSRFVDLRVVGDRLLVEQRNLAFRALTDRPAERAAVRESFASSVLWAGVVDVREPDGRCLVDLTPFIVRDAHAVAARLDRAGQGSFAYDAARSVVDTRACLAFPRNVELEGIVTFTAAKPGPLVRGVAADPRAITFTVHHTFVTPPDDGYVPRDFDPRTGSFAVEFLDFAADLEQPIRRAWIMRHRLERTDAAAGRSPARRPIVYHVDRGVPEPVRSAVIDGAAWWADAFEAAGFENAFRVEELPPGAHPLDARYNVIQWAHRATRGWSYGGSIWDPRTGEIVKGHVTLGSLRVRQDRLLFEGLAGTDATGSGGDDDPVQLALARIRQLAAHEVGHTLGFAHNFAASANDRSSVMDYPAPLVRVTGGRLDFGRAYAVGIGAWDVHTVRFAYAQFPPGTDEPAALAAIVAEGIAAGHVFLSDPDARDPGTAHPIASLWDNGADPVAALQVALDVRAAAIARFGERNVRAGIPLSRLQEVFAPVYMHHRYQVAAVAKSVGGLEYVRAVRGDGQPAVRPAAAAAQHRALRALLATLDPNVLDIPDEALRVLAPPTYASPRRRELLAGRAAPAFDGLAAASAAADLAIVALLHPRRCARMVDQHRRDPERPGMSHLLGGLMQTAFRSAPPEESERLGAIRRAVRDVLVERLVALAQDGRAPAAVRGQVNESLRVLAASLAGTDSWHARELRSLITRHLERPFDTAPPVRASDPPPPGDPIGVAPLACCGQQ
jgi:hypothetical protein